MWATGHTIWKSGSQPFLNQAPLLFPKKSQTPPELLSCQKYFFARSRHCLLRDMNYNAQSLLKFIAILNNIVKSLILEINLLKVVESTKKGTPLLSTHEIFY